MTNYPKYICVRDTHQHHDTNNNNLQEVRYAIHVLDEETNDYIIYINAYFKEEQATTISNSLNYYHYNVILGDENE